jgi:PPOX class probable F420-dependent enzyme
LYLDLSPGFRTLVNKEIRYQQVSEEAPIMPLKALTLEETRVFLERSGPAMLGVVGTLDEDGGPHLVPVWYRYDGERINIWTLERRRWVKNLARDPRVAFSVQEDLPPYAAVSLRGRATITTSDGEEVAQEIRRITRRYVEEPDVEEYIHQWAHLRTIVRITPEKISGWVDSDYLNAEKSRYY